MCDWLIQLRVALTQPFIDTLKLKINTYKTVVKLINLFTYFWNVFLSPIIILYGILFDLYPDILILLIPNFNVFSIYISGTYLFWIYN